MRFNEGVLLNEFDKFPYEDKLAKDALLQIKLARVKIEKSVLCKPFNYEFRWKNMKKTESLMAYTLSQVGIIKVMDLIYKYYGEKGIGGIAPYDFASIVVMPAFLLYMSNFIIQYNHTDTEILRENELEEKVVKSIKKLDKGFRKTGEISLSEPKPEFIIEFERQREKKPLRLNKLSRFIRKWKREE